MESMIESVNHYTEIGIIVHPLIPVVPGDKNTGKAPIPKGWEEKTTPYEARYIEHYLSKGCNIGANCGKASDLTVIDIDYYNKGIWDYVFEGIDTSRFVIQQRTQKDGKKHLMFKYNPNLKTTGYQELGFDIRNDSGNIVLAPSIHYEGDTYKMLSPIESRPELPEMCVEKINEIIENYAQLKRVFGTCRQCFYKLWKAVFYDKKSDLYHDTTIFRQAEGRARHLNLMAELKANGATDAQLILVCMLIFGEYYKEFETQKEIHKIDAKKTARNDTLQADEYYSKYLTAGVGKYGLAPAGPVNENGESLESALEEISLSELKELKQDLNNRRMPNLMEILPPDHYINKVTNWMSGLSDTYYEYQVSSALWLLSALIQGKGHVALKQGKIHPNLYIMIIGQSTRSRKSTAVRKVKNVFESATDTDLYNDDPTIEGYLEMLSKNPVSNFVRDEVSGLLAKYHKKYNDGIFDLECNVYDGDSVRKVKAAGREKEPKEFIIRNPYVTHLYATTPDKFTTVMALEDYLCGYGYRFLYAFPTYEKARMDYDIEDNENAEAWASVMAATKILYNRYNEAAEFKFTVTPEAMRLYNKIGISLEDAGERLNNDQIDSAIGRTQDNILKLAMLIEIGKSTPSHEITEESICVASLMTVDFFLPSFMQIMDRILTDVKVNKIEKAISVIRRMGGNCTRSTLIKNAHFTKKECDEAIEAMVMGGILLAKRVTETKTVTYILTTESNTLELHSTELTDMFEEVRKIRTFRTFRSFASNTKNLAKSAKSDGEAKNNTLMCGTMLKVYSESAKFAKSAKSAKSEFNQVTDSDEVPEDQTVSQMLNMLDEDGVI